MSNVSRSKRRKVRKDPQYTQIPRALEEAVEFALGRGLTLSIRSPMGDMLERAENERRPKFDRSQYMHVAATARTAKDLTNICEEDLVKFATGSRLLRKLENTCRTSHAVACLWYGDYAFRETAEGRDSVLMPATKLGRKLLTTLPCLGDDTLGKMDNIIETLNRGQNGGMEMLWRLREDARKMRLEMQYQLMLSAQALGYVTGTACLRIMPAVSYSRTKLEAEFSSR